MGEKGGYKREETYRDVRDFFWILRRKEKRDTL